MSEIKLKESELLEIQDCLNRINEILSSNINNTNNKKLYCYKDGFYYALPDNYDEEEEEAFKESILDAIIVDAFYNIVKKILRNTTNNKGRIIYENYQVGYKQIPYSFIFEIIDIDEDKVIGEYHREKNELIMY